MKSYNIKSIEQRRRERERVALYWIQKLILCLHQRLSRDPRFGQPCDSEFYLVVVKALKKLTRYVERILRYYMIVQIAGARGCCYCCCWINWSIHCFDLRCFISSLVRCSSCLSFLFLSLRMMFSCFFSYKLSTILVNLSVFTRNFNVASIASSLTTSYLFFNSIVVLLISALSFLTSSKLFVLALFKRLYLRCRLVAWSLSLTSFLSCLFHRWRRCFLTMFHPRQCCRWRWLCDCSHCKQRWW